MASDPDYVNYVAFSDDIEAIFTTKDLEKAPLLEVEPYKPPVEWEQNNLSPEMEGLVLKCLERLAEQVWRDEVTLANTTIVLTHCPLWYFNEFFNKKISS